VVRSRGQTVGGCCWGALSFQYHRHMRPLFARLLAAIAVIAASASGWTGTPSVEQACAAAVSAVVAAVLVVAPSKKTVSDNGQVIAIWE
jgi:hypothetical protein